MTFEAKKAKMVMPPIYRFDFQNDDEARNWGWHRVTDLIEVVNNIRHLQNKSALPASTIGVEYDTVRPSHFNIVCESSYDGENPRIGSMAAPLHGQSYRWLDLAASQIRCFIPAKIGMALIKEVKSPKRPLLQRVRSAVTELVR
ncbi:MAG: hypothetical protein AAB428_02595 [Patescibacteria group bacterium]